MDLVQNIVPANIIKAMTHSVGFVELQYTVTVTHDLQESSCVHNKTLLPGTNTSGATWISGIEYEKRLANNDSSEIFFFKF